MTFSAPLTHFNLMLLCTTQQKPVKLSDGLCIAFRLPAYLSCVFSSAAMMKKWEDILFKVIVWLSLLRELKWLSLDFQLPCLFFWHPTSPAPLWTASSLFLCSPFTTSSKCAVTRSAQVLSCPLAVPCCSFFHPDVLTLHFFPSFKPSRIFFADCPILNI